MATTAPPNPELSTHVVVDAALSIVRRGGTDALSMRAVGRELGVSTMAAYRHMGGREHLGALMLDRVFEPVAQDEEHDSLSALLLAAVVELARYPGLADELRGAALQQRNVAEWLDQVASYMPDHVVREDRTVAALWLVRGASGDAPHLPALTLLADALAAPARLRTVPRPGRNQQLEEG